MYDGPPHGSPTENEHHHDHHRPSTPPLLRPTVKAPFDGSA